MKLHIRKQTLMFLLFCLIFSMLMTGIHNLDNAWNMRIYEMDSGWSLTDCGLVNCRTTDQLYMQSMITILFSTIVLSFMIIYLTFNRSLILDD